MKDEELCQIINNYVKVNLSPTQEQRDYISAKYAEIRRFLQNNCFQSGSYARYTASNPVHDLDVIHPVADFSLKDEPSLVVEALYATLVEGYESSDTRIKNITIQTHSVTVVFDDTPNEFSVDIVPAIELSDQRNEYDDPLYLVPEILLLNKHNRDKRYENSPENEVNWIVSDPRGYTKAASEMNNSNSDFRHAAKLLKSWRHVCKTEFGDEFCFKSFHLEQIMFNIFSENNETTTIEAVTESLAAIPGYLTDPQIKDRADSERYIDQYVEELTTEQKQLILRLQTEAYEIVRKLPGCQTESEVVDCLDELLKVKKTKSFSFVPAAAPAIVPHQPWSC